MCKALWCSMKMIITKNKKHYERAVNLPFLFTICQVIVMKHTKTNNHSQSHLLVMYSSKFLSSAYFGLQWEARVPRKKPRRHRVNKQTLHRKTPDLIQPVTFSVGDNQHEFYLYYFILLSYNMLISQLCVETAKV